jgi:ABC-2 type transport system permease protein
MKTIGWIVWKDLGVFFADRKGAAMVVIVPLVLGLFMGLIFNTGEGPDPIRLVVVDEDGGDAVRRFLLALERDPGLQVERRSATEARDLVFRGKVAVALRLPAGASERLSAATLFSGADRGRLDLWFDPASPTEADIVEGLVTKAMMEAAFTDLADAGRQRQFFAGMKADLGDDAAKRPALASFLDAGLAWSSENEAVSASTEAATPAGPPSDAGSPALRTPLEIQREALVAAGPTAGFHSHAHTFAGMLMQFLMFAASGQCRQLYAERANGTLDRLRGTAARPWQILLGTGVAMAIVSVIATTVVFSVGALVFSVPFRSGLLAFALVTLGQAAFMGAFTLLLAGLADSEKRLDATGTLLILVLCFVSGAWVPSFMLPSFLQQAGPLVPTRWIQDGMAGATWRGLGLGHAALASSVLFAWAALLGTVGIRRFRWG